jgi:hypothetical protein
MRYKITKYLTAKNIKDASRQEPAALSIELDEPDEPQVNTHAIGFHVDTDRMDSESYDPSP